MYIYTAVQWTFQSQNVTGSVNCRPQFKINDKVALWYMYILWYV